MRRVWSAGLGVVVLVVMGVAMEEEDSRAAVTGVRKPERRRIRAVSPS